MCNLLLCDELYSFNRFDDGITVLELTDNNFISRGKSLSTLFRNGVKFGVIQDTHVGAFTSDFTFTAYKAVKCFLGRILQQLLENESVKKLLPKCVV